MFLYLPPCSIGAAGAQDRMLQLTLCITNPGWALVWNRCQVVMNDWINEYGTGQTFSLTMTLTTRKFWISPWHLTSWALMASLGAGPETRALYAAPTAHLKVVSSSFLEVCEQRLNDPSFWLGFCQGTLSRDLPRVQWPTENVLAQKGIHQLSLIPSILQIIKLRPRERDWLPQSHAAPHDAPQQHPTPNLKQFPWPHPGST